MNNCTIKAKRGLAILYVITNFLLILEYLLERIISLKKPLFFN